MIKLPLLQPHLTSGNGVDKQAGSLSKYSPFFATSRHRGERNSLNGEGSTGGCGIDVRDWEAQARDITTDVAQSDKYKSLALASDVRLAEALERCARLCPTTHTAAGDERPSKLKTAVCCQLLGEFAELCGPFNTALRGIRDELIQSIYSGMYSSERGTLSYDQLPWFTVAERLEAEKEVMLEEKQKFTAMLHEQQEVILRIEQQMASFQRATEMAQLEAAQLRSRLEGLVASEELARTEARTGREELKRVRKEWLKLRDDLEAERDAHRKLKETSDQESSAAKAQVILLQDALIASQADLTAAQQQLAVRLPAEAVAGLQEQVKQLTAEGTEMKKKLDQLDAALKEAEGKAGNMTPRPSWRTHRKYGIEEGPGKRTQDLVALAAEKLAAFAMAAQSGAARASDLELLLAEEPRPAEITLAVATDASAYFITESGGDSGKALTSSSVSAEGLGRGPHVPRCLRRRAGTMVTGVQLLTVEQTEALCCHIWQAKQVHDAMHAPEHLQSYLYMYFSHQLAPGVSAAAGNSPSASFSAAPPGALHHAITQHAYSLYHSLATHCRTSTIAHTFRSILFGQLPEAVHLQQQQVFASLLSVAQQATASASRAQSPSGDSGAPGDTELSVPTLPMLDALQRLCAGLPGYKTSRLKEAYMQSVGPVAAPLSKVEALLRPLAGLYDAAGVLGALRDQHQRMAALIKADAVEEDREGEDMLRRMHSWLSPGSVTKSAPVASSSDLDAYVSILLATQPPSMASCLGNAFVSTLLQLLVEHYDTLANAIGREVTHIPADRASPSPLTAGSAPSTPWTLSQAEADELGGLVSMTAIATALQAAGLSPPHTAQLCVASACSSQAGSAWSTVAHAESVYARQVVWAGQALVKIMSDSAMLLPTPKMFPDVSGMITSASRAATPI